MKELTRAEEEVMQILWGLGEANVAAMVREFPDPKPAYNTVSTVVRILENKGFIDHRKKGKGYIYFPTVTKSSYCQYVLQTLTAKYFQGSFPEMVSFLVSNKCINAVELREVLARPGSEL